MRSVYSIDLNKLHDLSCPPRRYPQLAIGSAVIRRAFYINCTTPPPTVAKGRSGLRSTRCRSGAVFDSRQAKRSQVVDTLRQCPGIARPRTSDKLLAQMSAL